MGIVDLRTQSTRRTPEQMLKHLKAFELDLKFSAGIWFFGKGAIRFHEAYGPPLSIAERLDIAAGLANYGLAAMEAHYPNEISEENLDLWKQFTQDTGIRVVTIVPNLFYAMTTVANVYADGWPVCQILLTKPIHTFGDARYWSDVPLVDIVNQTSPRCGVRRV